VSTLAVAEVGSQASLSDVDFNATGNIPAKVRRRSGTTPTAVRQFGTLYYKDGGAFSAVGWRPDNDYLWSEFSIGIGALHGKIPLGTSPDSTTWN